MVKGKVVQFRMGKRTYTPRHFLIEISEVDDREKAKKFIGDTVEWKSPGKTEKIISGKIASTHGNKGVLRAIFEKGLPGQAIGTEVEVKK
jgi:large subunit ribosomal protein L35Ae